MSAWKALFAALAGPAGRVRGRLGMGLSLAIAGIVGGAVIYAAVVFSLPPPETLSVLTGRTEKLAVRTLIPQQSAIAVEQVRLTAVDFDASGDGRCVTGVVTPAPRSVVAYRRAGSGPVVITISHPESAGALMENGAPTRLGPIVALAVDPAGCPGSTAPPRLPIWGPVEVGDNLSRAGLSDPDDRSYLMLSGKLQVYARAITLGGWLGSPVLYPVRDVELPPGARLSTGSLEAASAEPAWGVLTVDGGSEGFGVSLSTQTSRLSVSVPGAGPEPDVFDTTSVVQTLSDPNLIAIQVILGGLWLATQVVATLVAIAAVRSAARA